MAKRGDVYVKRPLPGLEGLQGETGESMSATRRAMLDQLMLIVRIKTDDMSKAALVNWLSSLIMDHTYPMTNDQIALWIDSIANWKAE